MPPSPKGKQMTVVLDRGREPFVTYWIVNRIYFCLILEWEREQMGPKKDLIIFFDLLGCFEYSLLKQLSEPWGGSNQKATWGLQVGGK